MDQGFTLSFGAFVAGLLAVGWWLVQRQMTKGDEEYAEWKRHQEGRCDKCDIAVMELRLQLERKLSREELDKVYDAIKEVSNKVDANSLRTIELLTTLVGQQGTNYERPR